jgi:hypothetical protein
MTATVRIARKLPLTSLIAIVLLLAGASTALAAAPPVKEILESHIGTEVDRTTKAGICTVASKHECQPGKFSSQPGGFEFAKSVAGAPAPGANVYVAENGNHRVQELTATGAFVTMFGKEVNETTKGDVCSAEEITKAAVKCKAGIGGSAPGQLSNPLSIAVDQSNGDVYVTEFVEGESNKEHTTGQRVQKFTADGQFVLEIGNEVNPATKGNLCTREEEVNKGVKCTGPTPHTSGAPTSSSEPFLSRSELPMAVGGPEDLLYVGDEHRVQEFEANGKYKKEISLTSISSAPGSNVSAIVVDSLGNVYLTYRENAATDVIREFNPNGEQGKEFPVTSRHGGEVSISGIALDSSDRFAVTEGELAGVRGSLYDIRANQLHLITEFVDLGTNGLPGNGLAFNGNDELYIVAPEEIVANAPVPVAELLAAPHQCVSGSERETDLTLDCTLSGEIDAWGVTGTEAWFQWGSSAALGQRTEPPVAIANVKGPGEEEPLVAVHAVLVGLAPNEHFYYRLAAQDANVRSPEVLTGETTVFTTPLVAPVVLGEPSVSFLGSSSAVMFGELNPENAGTEFFFEYAPGEALSQCPLGVRRESCPNVAVTASGGSATYGRTATTLEASGLQPATTYRYRLFAESHNASEVRQSALSASSEGSFTTSPAAVPRAETGLASAISSTGAVISGAVDPDGQPATYSFELGIYQGAGTSLGTVFSGAAGAGSVPVAQTLQLTGLQPGTTYAYRIKLASGYGQASGATMTFTTQGLPSVLGAPSPLAVLAVPSTAFPAAVTSMPSTKALTNAQKLAKALKACKKKAKKQRAACEKQARKRYAKSKQANGRKKG